jgi:hypothetical protein
VLQQARAIDNARRSTERSGAGGGGGSVDGTSDLEASLLGSVTPEGYLPDAAANGAEPYVLVPSRDSRTLWRLVRRNVGECIWRPLLCQASDGQAAAACTCRSPMLRLPCIDEERCQTALNPPATPPLLLRSHPCVQGCPSENIHKRSRLTRQGMTRSSSKATACAPLPMLCAAASGRTSQPPPGSGRRPCMRTLAAWLQTCSSSC